MALSYSIKDTAVTPAVAPTIAPTVTPLLSLVLISVVASRGRIRVTVFFGDCQAHVSSSSEGCVTLHKRVNMEAYEPIILALSDRN